MTVAEWIEKNRGTKKEVPYSFFKKMPDKAEFFFDHIKGLRNYLYDTVHLTENSGQMLPPVEKMLP